MNFSYSIEGRSFDWVGVMQPRNQYHISSVTPDMNLFQAAFNIDNHVLINASLNSPSH